MELTFHNYKSCVSDMAFFIIFFYCCIQNKTTQISTVDEVTYDASRAWYHAEMLSWSQYLVDWIATQDLLFL